jgi:hypothetical protein
LAPPRKPPEPGQTHPIHLRFPPDVFERITAKAKASGIPINRVVINEVAQHPYLEQQAKLGELIGHMENTLARYGSRFTNTELSESILQAVDEILAAQTPGDREAPIDKLRIFRGAILKIEREAAQAEREQQAARIALLEGQLAAIEALPDSSIAKDEIPGRRRMIEQLKQAAAFNAARERE